jgi:hypothetical protein
VAASAAEAAAAQGGPLTAVQLDNIRLEARARAPPLSLLCTTPRPLLLPPSALAPC